MPLIDLVVDANIIGHSENPELGAYFNEASQFLEDLAFSSTTLCFDAPISTDEAANESRIFREYLDTVSLAALASPVLATLLSTERWKIVPGRVSQHVRTKVNRLVAANKAIDRLLVCVAYNSDEGIVVSHDHEDFTDTVRDGLPRELDVEILEACEVSPRL